MQADVAIAGASFAGLGLAYHLRGSGLDVLLIDRKGVGEGRTSTCGMPANLADSLAPGSALARVDRFYVETPRLRRTFRIAEEYCVIDYKKFCTSLFRQSGARFVKSDVLGPADNGILTSSGLIEARFIADCTGWRRTLSRDRDSKPKKVLSAVEITAPISSRYDNRLNFFIDKSLIPGYAWIFPIGGGLAHVGIGGTASGAALNGALMRFLGRVGVEFTKNGLVGGGIPCIGLGRPVEANVFFVGDSARQALPLSAEGIRTSLHFSRLCADAIKASAGERMGLKEALSSYERSVRRSSGGFWCLQHLQEATLAFPQAFFDFCVFCAAIPPLDRLMAEAYLSIAKSP